jgi:hypothetical protein
MNDVEIIRTMSSSKHPRRTTLSVMVSKSASSDTLENSPAKLQPIRTRVNRLKTMLTFPLGGNSTSLFRIRKAQLDKETVFLNTQTKKKPIIPLKRTISPIVGEDAEELEDGTTRDLLKLLN